MAKNTQQLIKADTANQQQIAARQAQAQQLRQVEYHEAEVRASAQVCILSTPQSHRGCRQKLASHRIEFQPRGKARARKIRRLFPRKACCPLLLHCLISFSLPLNLTSPYHLAHIFSFPQAGLNLNIFGAISGVFSGRSKKTTDIAKDGSSKSVEHSEGQGAYKGAAAGTMKAVAAGQTQVSFVLLSSHVVVIAFSG